MKFVAYAENTTYTFTTNVSLDAEAEYNTLERIATLHPDVRDIEVFDDFGFYDEFELLYTHYVEKATKYELTCGGKTRIYDDYSEALETKKNLLTFFDEKEIQLVKIN